MVAHNQVFKIEMWGNKDYFRITKLVIYVGVRKSSSEINEK